MRTGAAAAGRRHPAEADRGARLRPARDRDPARGRRTGGPRRRALPASPRAPTEFAAALVGVLRDGAPELAGAGASWPPSATRSRRSAASSPSGRPGRAHHPAGLHPQPRRPYPRAEHVCRTTAELTAECRSSLTLEPRGSRMIGQLPVHGGHTSSAPASAQKRPADGSESSRAQTKHGADRPGARALRPSASHPARAPPIPTKAPPPRGGFAKPGTSSRQPGHRRSRAMFPPIPAHPHAAWPHSPADRRLHADLGDRRSRSRALRALIAPRPTPAGARDRHGLPGAPAFAERLRQAHHPCGSPARIRGPHAEALPARQPPPPQAVQRRAPRRPARRQPARERRDEAGESRPPRREKQHSSERRRPRQRRGTATQQAPQLERHAARR